MLDAFRTPGPEGGADFSGMTESRDLRDQLYISLVVHQAFVDVNEKGTEAAAATAVQMAATSISEYVDFVPEFRADHPFVFLIRHAPSHAILFMGRMMNPSASR